MLYEPPGIQTAPRSGDVRNELFGLPTFCIEFKGAPMPRRQYFQRYLLVDERESIKDKHKVHKANYLYCSLLDIHTCNPVAPLHSSMQHSYSYSTTHTFQTRSLKIAYRINPEYLKRTKPLGNGWRRRERERCAPMTGPE